MSSKREISSYSTVITRIKTVCFNKSDQRKQSIAADEKYYSVAITFLKISPSIEFLFQRLLLLEVCYSTFLDLTMAAVLTFVSEAVHPSTDHVLISYQRESTLSHADSFKFLSSQKKEKSLF